MRQKKIWQQEKQQQQQDNKLKPKEIIKREIALSFRKRVAVDQASDKIKENTFRADDYLRKSLGI